MARQNIRVRGPARGDEKEIVSIVRSITKRRPSPGFKRMVSQYLHHNKDTCLIGEVGGRPVGFILGAVKEYGFGVQKTGWIEVLGVLPSHMGSGIGKMLGRRMISVFKKRGVRAIHTAVQWKSGDLLAFFNGLGFEKSTFLTLELPIPIKNRKR